MLVISGPEAAAQKILSISETLGGISRFTFQISPAALPHAKNMHAIELLRTRVAPLVRRHIDIAPSPEAQSERLNISQSS